MLLRIVFTMTLISLAIVGVIAGIITVFSVFNTTRVFLCLAVLFLLDALLLYGVFEHRAPIFGKVFWKGSKHLRAISITFDDGPNEPYTSQVLDILKAFNIKATFFPIGENVEIFPEVVRRENKEGHEIGNHTYNHEVLPLKSPRYIRQQIKRTSDLIEKVTGTRPKLFRAPHGWRNPWVNRIVRQQGCIPVAWTLGVWDTDRPGAEAIVKRTLKGLKNGCILLLHDGRGTEHGTDSSQLLKALPIIINKAHIAGYKFLTVSEMLEKAKAR